MFRFLFIEKVTIFFYGSNVRNYFITTLEGETIRKRKTKSPHVAATKALVVGVKTGS